MSGHPLPAAVILDRDGVINDYDEPVNRPDQLRVFPWSASAIRRLNDSGYRVMVATNQGGVGLGYLSAQELDAIHEHLSFLLAREGAHIDAYAACTHAPRARCSCRKPRPGLIEQLHELVPFDRAASFMIGDQESDVEAGLAAGLRAIRIGPAPDGTRAEYIAADLADAVRYILEAPRGHHVHRMGRTHVDKGFPGVL
jgi:D-glycero-D-manno-heptose 1,7-bisphosphate phosphatase